MRWDDELQWQQVDEIESRALPYIGAGDYCYYFLSRVNGGYAASTANSRISDFKKPLERFSGRPDVLWYKEREIEAFSRDLARLLTGQLAMYCQTYDVALVPINTSRPTVDPYHDDRLVRLCNAAAELVGDVRVADCMHSRQHMQPSHAGGPRDYEVLAENLAFDGFGPKVPDVAILVDDVLTKGTHYAVCRDAIRRAHGTGVLVIGAFLCIHRSDYVDYGSYGINQ